MLGQSEHDGARPHAVNRVHVSARAVRADGMGEASEPVREMAERPVGLRQGVGAFGRAGLQGQAQPLVQAVRGFPVHALQVQRAQDHEGLRGEDAERKVVEAPPALGILDRVPEEVPRAEVPLCRELFGGELNFHRRRKGRLGKRRQIGAPHRRHRAEPRLFRMGAGSLANGGQLLRGEFLQELPRGLRRRGQVERRLGRLRRRGSRRLRVEMPHVRMARRIRVRVAGMDGIHHLTRQVPGLPAGPGFSDGQLDNGRVARMVPLLGANHERHHVAALDCRFEALSGLGVVRDLLRAAGADVAVREDVPAGPGVSHNRPFDAVAAMRIAHRHAGPDAHATPERAAPADGHIAVRQGVHGDTPRRDAQVAREARLARRVGAEPGYLARGPAPHERHARDRIHLCGSAVPWVAARRRWGWRWLAAA